MTGTVKRGWLWVLKNTLNRLTLRAARSGRGPFSLVRHVGRKTGVVYETPLILAATPDAFVAELTYGPTVSWYRNIVAAGHCIVVYKGTEYSVDRIDPCTEAFGLSAFGPPATWVLTLLGRHEFRVLHRAGEPAPAGG